jgi:hypothetical protein
MLRIDDTIFSFDILEKKFRCNLPSCHGNCCRYGDSGAPLSDSEVKILKYLMKSGLKLNLILEQRGLNPLS